MTGKPGEKIIMGHVINRKVHQAEEITRKKVGDKHADIYKKGRGGVKWLASNGTNKGVPGFFTTRTRNKKMLLLKKKKTRKFRDGAEVRAAGFPHREMEKKVLAEGQTTQRQQLKEKPGGKEEKNKKRRGTVGNGEKIPPGPDQ